MCCRVALKLGWFHIPLRTSSLGQLSINESEDAVTALAFSASNNYLISGDSGGTSGTRKRRFQVAGEPYGVVEESVELRTL